MEQKDPNAKEGMRIRCVSMTDDPNPIAPGTEGTIRLVDGMGIIHVKWDNGRILGLIPGVDHYQLMPDPKSDLYDDTDKMFEDTSSSSAIKTAIKKTPSNVEKSMPKATKVSSSTTSSLKSSGIKTNQVSKNFKSANIKDIKVEQDQIKGGKADKLSIKDLVKKHKVSVEDIKKEIKIGVKIEREHVGNDVDKAKEIAMDHISEFPDYYSNKRYGVLASEKGLKKSGKKKIKTETTATAGGVSTGAYTGKLEEHTTTWNTDKTAGVSGIEFADLDHDGWYFDDVSFWKGGEIIDPLSKDKDITSGEKFWGPFHGPKSDKTKSAKTNTKVPGTKKTLKKEDLLRMVKNRIDESIKNVNSLIVGSKYIITQPTYDDYDEGLQPEIETVEVIKKTKNGYIFKNEDGEEYEMTFAVLKNCNIEEKPIEEATTFVSVWGSNGPPVGPAFAAKKGQWIPAKKPIWKGGVIVQKDANEGILNPINETEPINETNKVKYNPKGKYVKIAKKCTKFPYCNQGAIDNPLKISNTVSGPGTYVEGLDDETIKNIHEVSKETGKPFIEIYKTILNNLNT